MPYIENRDRERIDPAVQGFLLTVKKEAKNGPGILNYILSNIIHAYVEERLISYRVLNEVMGVLECVKQEYYRRIAAPYENKKIEENGDVYDTEGL
jgi:hypothetical protein